MVIRIWLISILVVWHSQAFSEGLSLTISTSNKRTGRAVLELVSKAVFQRMGIDFKLVDLPSERSLRFANNGIVNGEGMRVAGLGSRYPNLIQIPETYLQTSFVAFTKDPAIKVNGWDSLRGHRVAFLTGWKIFEKNASGAKTVIKVDNPKQLFLMLDKGRIDLALYTLTDGLALIRELNLPSVLSLSPSLKEADLFLYLHKKHKELVPQVAATIRKIKKDGTYAEIIASITGL